LRMLWRRLEVLGLCISVFNVCVLCGCGVFVCEDLGVGGET